MGRVFITGSADGLGQLAARDLVDKGYDVVLHARDESRGVDALRGVPGAADVLTADLSDLNETKDLAQRVNSLGRFDAIIHNAAVYEASADMLLAVNTLAPYILTSLIEIPARLIYLSSGMHRHGRAKFESFNSSANSITYSDTKLHVLMLAKAVARHWPNVSSNAVDPGWVPTKMGGSSAPDDLQKGFETQVWLAVSDDPKAGMSGRYLHHQMEDDYNPQADDVSLQERLLNVCEAATGVTFPRK